MGKIIYIYMHVFYFVIEIHVWNIFANFLIRRRVDAIINN